MPKTAHYHVPPVTVMLGAVLDLRVEDGQVRIAVDDWEGWLLLTDENAMDSNRPRLFLVAADLADGTELEAVGPAAQTYERWHRRQHDGVSDVDVSGEEIGYYQGRVLSIGYRSDKWGRSGEEHDYDHDFTEGEPPKLYTDRADIADARAAVVVGGDMRVTERGID